MVSSISVSALTSLSNKIAAALAGGESPLFELRPGPFVQNEWIALELHGEEGISKLSRFDIVAASRVETAVDLGGLAERAFGSLGKSAGLGGLGSALGGVLGHAAGSLLADAEATALELLLLGQPATLIIHSPHAPPRLFQGICTAIERLGPLGGESSDWHGYRLTLRPRLWLGTLRKNSRIFQDVSVKQIVDTILKEHHVPVRWSGGSKLPIRTFTVQHQETDYDFIKRLLAELGLFYYFEPPRGLANSLLGGPLVGGVAQAAAAFGGALGQLADVAGFTEKLVIGESSHCYSPIERADGSNPLDTVLGIAAGATGGARGAGAAASGGAFGKFSIDSDGVHLESTLRGSLGGGASAALGALGRLANASPLVVFRELTGLTNSEDFVFQLSLDRSLKPKRVTLRDFDYTHPGHQLKAHAKANPSLSGALDGDIRGGRLLALNTDLTSPAAIPTQELEIYDHHDEYQETDVNRDHARIQLEQYRRDVRVAEGQSVCQRLVPGYRFQLEDHPLRICNNEFAVTQVEHWGQIPEWKNTFRAESPPAGAPATDTLNYRNRFECVPAGIAYRMPRPPRRLFQVTETATVVGPPGSEIHTDSQGRIKVHFHWEREGHSSCWLRVAQPWSGAGWGHQVIPRVGMEVLVTFLGGDLDKPVVVACVPNAHHPMPFPLPSGTRSGIRTQSTPNCTGYNELSFEDAAEKEQIFLFAQRDLDEIVTRDHTASAGRDEHTSVGRDQTLKVQHDQTIRVGNTLSLKVDGNASTRIEKNDDHLVQGDSSYTVAGSSLYNVLEHFVTTVGQGETHQVGGNSDLGVRENSLCRVQGNLTTVVGTPVAKRSYLVHTEGNIRLESTDSLELRSDKSITLSCGKSSIHIGPEGTTIESPTIAVIGAGGSLGITKKAMKLSAQVPAAFDAKELLLRSSEGGRIGIGKAIAVDAQQILLNSPTRKADPESAVPPPELTTILLKDDEGNPVPGALFEVVLPDGTRRTGVLDANGQAQVELEQDAELLFPDYRGVKPN